mmetsp:Transcript_35368/g.75393  ORF Transcript_35368/g.75393 Transcript_35368/m.75393 type:complete len:204 (-) Transcript_35368:471-1082(-)
MAVHRLLHHVEGLHQLLPVLLDRCHLGVQELHLLVVPVTEGTELLVFLLFHSDGRMKTPDLVLDSKFCLLLLLQSIHHILQSFVAALHSHQRGAALLHQLLLLEVDGLHLFGCLSQSGCRSFCLLFLGDDLSVQEGFLLSHTLHIFVHPVDEEILFVLDFFDFLDVILRLVGCAARELDLGFDLLVVVLHLPQSDVELVEFIL